MKIIETYRDFTASEKYLMTMSEGAHAVNTLPDGTQLTPQGWLTYEDTDYRGETREMFSVIGNDADGNTVVWTTLSTTFKRTLLDMYAIFGEEQFTIKKTSGVTKSDKPYVNCDLAV